MEKIYHKNIIVAFAWIIKDAFKELTKNDPLRMAGATAFFTTFALPPILIILIQVLGLVFEPKKITAKLFEALSGIIQTEGVHQVVDTLGSFWKLSGNWMVTAAGFIFLVFVATTLFKVIKSSLNQVWRIKLTGKRSLRITIRTRSQSILVILVAGLLFVLGLVASAAQAFLGKYVYEFSPTVSFYFDSGLNYLMSVIIVTLWFAIVFRYLPDARPQWRVALMGALVTSLLFNTGKIVLRWMLAQSDIKTVYGASGSIVLLLLFVFYSSLILYFGAAFTKIWGAYYDRPIRPLPHAMHYRLAEVDEEGITEKA